MNRLEQYIIPESDDASSAKSVDVYEIANADNVLESKRSLKRAIRQALLVFSGTFSVAEGVFPVIGAEVYDSKYNVTIGAEKLNDISEKESKILEIYGENVYIASQPGIYEAPSNRAKEEFANSWPISQFMEDRKKVVEDPVQENTPIPLDSLSDIESRDTKFDNTILLFRILRNLPASWLESVSSIKQVENVGKRLDKYGLSDEWETVASPALTETGKTKITLFEATKESSDQENRETIYHEIGHANDWNRSLSLSYEEKIDLLLEVTERIDAEDRYRSGYVEAIENRNKQKEKHLKALEYWAEISAIYFTSPNSLSIADYTIVHKRVANKTTVIDYILASAEKNK